MEPKDEVKQRADVVEVVSEHLPLKSAGSGSFKALCPFHAEKTPSFYVSREKQIWHCFGCEKGGDVFSFLMEMEGMSFPEALRYLGKKVGVEVPEYSQKPDSNEKAFLIDLHDLAGRFYEKLLHEHPEGEIARDYIASRGIDQELAKKFRLGFAPDRWDALITFLKKRGFSEDRIVKAGLAKKKNVGQGEIDRFRGRLMIPLCEIRGRIVGFTGRLLKEESDEEKTGPKYLNSPETLIYHKGDILFGLDLAKTGIRQAGSVIIVEGNLDLIASHKAGVENVVASSGTALTESQLRQIKKLTSKIIFAFDADAAGFSAAQRGIRLAQGMGLDIAVISIPKEAGKDPDDVVQKDSQTWADLVKQPVHIMDYYFDKALQSFHLGQVEGKRGFAHFLTAEIARLEDPIEREHWLQKLADIIHVDIGVLRDVMRKQKTKTPVLSQRQSNLQKPLKTQKRTSRIDQAAAFLIGLALHDEELTEEVFSRFDHGQLLDDPWRRVYKNVATIYTLFKSSDSTQKNFFSRICDHYAEHGPETDATLVNASVLRTERAVADLSRDQVREELSRHLDILTTASQEAKRKQLEAAIRQAEQSGDSERLRALIEQYTKLL